MSKCKYDLSRETFRLNKQPMIEFRLYDTSLNGFVVIPVKPKDGIEEVMQDLGYQEVSEKEIKETKGLQRYPKYRLFKISTKVLEELQQ